MGDFNTIGQDRGIIYTCNCGWFDRGHAFTAPSKRSSVGPFRLWNSLLKEDGPPHVIGRVPIPAFVVTYRQDAVKKLGGMAFFPGEERTYVVRKGLSNVRKQGVALAILMEVSIAFESLQASLVSRALTGSDSGFSEEDLVSNIIGLYATIFPMIDVDSLCKPVSVAASQAVWKAYGAVGKNKNKRFKPIFHPCSECKDPPRFPPQFQVIQPAVKGIDFDNYVALNAGPWGY
jgi:hypothetical protein